MEESQNPQRSDDQVLIKGQPVSQEQLREIEKDGSKRLKEVTPGNYTVLEKMKG